MSKHDLLQLSSSRRSGETDNSLPQEIQQLVTKFDRISSSVNIDLKNNTLQLLGMERNGNFQEDPITKLKNIQNKSEMNRAEVQLMNQRRPKRYSLRTRREQQDNNRESYLQSYRKIKEENNITEDYQNDFQSDNQMADNNDHAPQGVKHYRYLKQHPKVLQYTLEKIKDRNSAQKAQTFRQQQLLQIKKASRPAALLFNTDFKQLIQNSMKEHVDSLESPKAIVDNQLTKFYSKSSKGKLDIKIRNNPRCNKLLQRQEKIISTVQDKQFSKENMKKLKEKLNQIVNEINKSDRKSQDILPKLTTNTSRY